MRRAVLAGPFALVLCAGHVLPAAEAPATPPAKRKKAPPKPTVQELGRLIAEQKAMIEA